MRKPGETFSFWELVGGYKARTRCREGWRARTDARRVGLGLNVPDDRSHPLAGAAHAARHCGASPPRRAGSLPRLRRTDSVRSGDLHHVELSGLPCPEQHRTGIPAESLHDGGTSLRGDSHLCAAPGEVPHRGGKRAVRPGERRGVPHGTGFSPVCRPDKRRRTGAKTDQRKLGKRDVQQRADPRSSAAGGVRPSPLWEGKPAGI